MFRTYKMANITKYGILMRLFCERESGQICNIEIHLVDEKKKLQKTILSILETYLSYGHHVYQDSYYTRVSTVGILLEKKILLSGTIRKNRCLLNVLICTNRKVG